MVIGDIITNNYQTFKSFCKTDDIVISQSRTSEDIFHDTLLQAVRHFGDSDIDENIGFDYIKKNLAAELHFQYKRKDKLITFLEIPPDVPDLPRS